MRNYEGKLVGILGTVIIHLIAGIIFMSFQMQSLKKKIGDEFIVEFETMEENDKEEKLIELPKSGIEKILQGDDEMLNIARNLANRAEEKIDPAKYIDMVKEELIKSGKLGADNYIDEQKLLDQLKGEENLSFKAEMSKEDEGDSPSESQKMAANFKGPTRIYYDLPGRTHTNLPIPIYMCEGAGNVVLTIEVNTKGEVEKAQVVSGKSTTSDPCLIETAVRTALDSRFNSDINAPKIQTGTLSYHFVAQ